MKVIKKYTDVTRFGKTSTLEAIMDAEEISITEKIDGANASFVADETNSIGVSCYSRNNPLSQENTLSGFYNWVNDNIVPIKDNLIKNYRYYGEWLIKHKVAYKDECYRNFYLFSIWDEDKEEYLSEDIVRKEAERLGLNTAPLLYQGKFISIDHIMSFVGKSDMTLNKDTGEGVVVKNINYKDKYGKQLFVKFISQQFSEVAKQKPHNVNTELIESGQKIAAIVTKNRIEKMLLKLVDEQIIDTDYTLEDMGEIIKIMNKAIYDDVIKEESDELDGIDEKILRKSIGKIVASVLKQIVLNK